MLAALSRVVATLTPGVSMQVRAKAKRKLVRKEWFVMRPSMKPKYRGNPNPRLRLILLADVEGIGMKGDVVRVTRAVGRNQLIPNKLAVYGTYENLLAHGIDPESVAEGAGAKVPIEVLNYLKKQEVNLTVAHANDAYEGTNWLVTRHDVIEYFWRHGHLVVPLKCIKLAGCRNNIIRELGSYTAEITLNNAVTVSVPVNVKENENVET